MKINQSEWNGIQFGNRTQYPIPIQKSPVEVPSHCACSQESLGYHYQAHWVSLESLNKDRESGQDKGEMTLSLNARNHLWPDNITLTKGLVFIYFSKGNTGFF